LHAGGVPADGRNRGVKFSLATAGDEDMSPFGRELFGGRETYTSGRAGDDRDLAFEFLCRLTISVGVVANRGIDTPKLLK
jgi:hypothetical protein